MDIYFISCHKDMAFWDTCLKVYGPWVLCLSLSSMYNRYYDVRYEMVLRDQNVIVIVFLWYILSFTTKPFGGK